MKRVFSWWPALLLGAAVLGGAGVTTSGILAPGEPAATGDIVFPLVHTLGGRILDAAAFGAALPAFEQRYLAEDRQAWEPTIGIGPDGTLYYMASTKPTTARTGMHDVDGLGGLHPETWRSSDGGLTWSDVSPQIENALRLLPVVGHQVSTPAISGDPYIEVDPVTGHVLQYHQQSFLLCDEFYYSDDEGETWGHHDTCVASNVDDDSYGDHPTLATGPRVGSADRITYFCASSGCRSSLDGGASWSASSMPFADCEIQLGSIEVGPEGHLYVPRKACGGAQLAVSEDEGATWRVELVDDTVWTTGQEAGFEGWDHDAVVAADKAGNLYYLWMSDARLPHLAVSRDAGVTWSAPMAVAAPGVTYALFPTIVAGDEGRIAFSYFATDVESARREDPDAVWRQYVTVGLDALAAEPAFATTFAHPVDDAVRRGPCFNFRCYTAPGPQGNGVPYEAVGDFIDIDLDPSTGGVVLGFVDLCNGACATGSAADPAYNRGAVAVQVGGATLAAPQG